MWPIATLPEGDSGPPVRGGGIPHRIMLSSRPVSVLRTNRIVWKHARHRREVADIAVVDAKN
jgi:hypothetical protein